MGSREGLVELEELEEGDIHKEIDRLEEAFALGTKNGTDYREERKTKKEEKKKESARDKGVNYNFLQAYLNDIRKIRKASKEEKQELFRKFKLGDQEAKKKLIEYNLPLVVTIAKRIRNHYEPEFQLDMLDMIQEGDFGLIRAVEKYNLDKINPKNGKPYEFSTYASWWIKQFILRGISRHIRLPAYMLERIERYNAVYEKMLQEYGKKPEREDIAKFMDISIDKIRNIEIYRSMDFISLESEVSEEKDSHLLKDFIKDESFVYASISAENKDAYIFFNKLIDNLKKVSQRDKDIFRMRHSFDGNGKKTLLEIGRSYNLSRERVRQIENKVLEKVRQRTPQELYL